ncbi:MAG: hypothetical protein M1834_005309 [Cirrosporium novae-zelandiae]|nr:MAG: hypothetical protein M1834_005309 [Cirrosporium novae-zelandiae]
MDNFDLENLPILWRGKTPEPEYEAARCRVFNVKRPNDSPLAIVKPKTVAHIVAAVKLASRLDTQIAVRSGGHSLSCWTLRADSILIDLENFNHLVYDEQKQEVQTSPSVTSSELLKFLATKNRSFPGGHCGDIGLGGYLLQGGIGLNSRSYGYACEYIARLDVVTAAGELKHCSKDENSDLYWAARGAGPEFPAIVTRFYLKTRPLLPVYKRCTYIWPITSYETVFKWLLDLLPSIDEDIEPIGFGFTLPNINQPALVIHVLVFADSDASAVEKLKPIRDTHPPGLIVAQDCIDTSVQQEYDSGGNSMPKGARYHTDSVFLDPAADVIETCREMFTKLPHKGALAYWQPMRTRTTAAADRSATMPAAEEEEDMALSFIQSEHYVSILAIYDDAGEDDFQKSWVNEYMRRLEPHTVGTFVADAQPRDRPHKYWSDAATKRLLDIGRKWDPSGRIRGILLN